MDDDDDNVKDDGDDVDNVKDGLPEQKRPLHPSRLLCCASLPSLVLSIIITIIFLILESMNADDCIDDPTLYHKL